MYVMKSLVLTAMLILAGSSVAGCGDTQILATSPAVWEQVPDPPLSGRTEAAVGWTGEEIVVAGGNDFLCGGLADCTIEGDAFGFTDGAAYNPATRTWRPIAPAPAPIWSASSASVAGDAFFLATRGPDEPQQALLRYDGDTDRWEAVELPADSVFSQITAAGESLVMHAGSDELRTSRDWRYDAATRRWEALPDDPLGAAFDRTYIADGGDLYLFDKELVPQPGGEDGPAFVRAARLRGGQWETLPVSDMIGGGAAIVDGDRIVFPALGCADGGDTNGYGRCIPFGAMFDIATGDWADLPDAPNRGEKDVWSAGAVTDGQALIWSAGAPYLDLTDDTWYQMPDIGDGDDVQRQIHGAGPHAFTVGGGRFDSNPDGELLRDAWIWTAQQG